jgi:predicted amidohydrolase YtcJ
MTPSFFTGHTFFWGDVHVENTGPERAGFIEPDGRRVRAGLRCSNHSDFSVTPMDPFRMMHSSMLRRSRSGVVHRPRPAGRCADRAADDDHRRGLADLRGGHQGLDRARASWRIW